MDCFAEERDQGNCLNTGQTKNFVSVFIHISMATNTISIRDEAYNLLKNAKLEGESFSDVIDRLLKNEKGICRFISGL